MRKLFSVLFLAIFLIASSLPPSLPSSFWGNVYGGRVGQPVAVSVDGITIAKTTVIAWEENPVYSINVPMDGITDGTLATFRVNGIVAGQAKLYSGTNVNLNLSIFLRIFRR